MLFYALCAGILLAFYKAMFFITVPRNCLMSGVIYGILFGDMMECVTIACSIQALFIGNIAVGGQPPSDQMISGALGIPIAYLAGLDYASAMVIVIPIGLFGTQLTNIQKIVFGFLVPSFDKAAEECNLKKFVFLTTVVTMLFNLAFFGTIGFIAVYAGANVVVAALNAIPAWVLKGLTAGGSVLPSVGFAITMMVIGQKKIIPFFIVGFFLAKVVGLSAVVVGVFAVCTAILITFGVEKTEA